MQASDRKNVCLWRQKSLDVTQKTVDVSAVRMRLLCGSPPLIPTLFDHMYTKGWKRKDAVCVGGLVAGGIPQSVLDKKHMPNSIVCSSSFSGFPFLTQSNLTTSVTKHDQTRDFLFFFPVGEGNMSVERNSCAKESGESYSQSGMRNNAMAFLLLFISNGEEVDILVPHHPDTTRKSHMVHIFFLLNVASTCRTYCTLQWKSLEPFCPHFADSWLQSTIRPAAAAPKWMIDEHCHTNTTFPIDSWWAIVDECVYKQVESRVPPVLWWAQLLSFWFLFLVDVCDFDSPSPLVYFSSSHIHLKTRQNRNSYLRLQSSMIRHPLWMSI